MSNIELNRELSKLKEDKRNNEIELKQYQNRMSFLLRGEMGEDIKNVINGKVKVKLSLKEKIRYKFKAFLNYLFNVF